MTSTPPEQIDRMAREAVRKRNRTWAAWSLPLDLDPKDQSRIRRVINRLWPTGKNSPLKPKDEPTSINFEDYGYYLPGGKFKFWMGYDAKFKSRLMRVARDPDHPDNDKALAILAMRCWSTPEHEREIRGQNARKALRATDKEATP